MIRIKQINELTMVNKFKANLYVEFERNCFHIFGLPGARIREILSLPDDLYEMYEEAWNFGGARFMRQTMAFTILTLEKIYYEDEIGRILSEDEIAERFESFDIGMDAEGIDEWNEKRVKQLDSKGHYDDAKKYIKTYR